MGITSTASANEGSAFQHDFSHHLSPEAHARLPHVMKEFAKLLLSRPGMISLANGDPHHSLYPIRQVAVEVASVSSRDPVAAWRTGSAPHDSFQSLSVPDSGSLTLIDALAYGPGVGTQPTIVALQKLIDVLYSPRGHVVTLTLGNADALTKAFRLLGSPGDHFLADEFSFTGVTEAAIAHGVSWVPVRIDDGGMIPEDLERILKLWDAEKQGKKPHVLYTVPTGQNPTGSTLTLERRKQIYQIAQEWDLIIVEDDPYHFLQFDKPEVDTLDENFLQNFCQALTPTFLSMDVDGRVLRSDSFSKLIAPGMRIGAITTSPFFQGYLTALVDNSTQQPAGFSQFFLTEMLAERGWGLDGFARWGSALCKEYQRKRDYFSDVFNHTIQPTGLASLSLPQGGMFTWIKIHVELHPRFSVKTDASDPTVPRTNTHDLMEELFNQLVDAGLATIPAERFIVNRDPLVMAHEDGHLLDRVNYFRATFAGLEEVMDKGLLILEKTLRQFFIE